MLVVKSVEGEAAASEEANWVLARRVEEAHIFFSEEVAAIADQ